MRVAVVGGGLAGLSAAVALKDAGFEVVLFERSRLLGGKATSFEVDGFEVDNGQHVYLACCTEFTDFVSRCSSFVSRSSSGERAASNEERATKNEQRSTHNEARTTKNVLFLQHRFEALLLARGKPPARLQAAPLPAPFHLAPALLRYRHLTMGDRFGVARAMLSANRRPKKGETFAGWLSRQRQSEAARAAFWEPFLVPALNASLDQVSADDALFVIRTAFLHDSGAARFGYSRVPLARIAEAAAERLDQVHLRTPVVGIESQVASRKSQDLLQAGRGGSQVTGGGWTHPAPKQHARDERPADPEGAPDLQLVTGDGSRVPCNGAVLAVPPDRLAKLLGEPESYGVSGLDAFRAAPIVDVHLWYDIPTAGFDFAALLDSPVQWVFEKGAGYLCCSMSAADAHAGCSNAELVELCHHELTELVPALTGATLLRGSATRDREATFIPAPGLRRPGPVTSHRRVVIAGAWTDTGWPATMESAVRSGRAAARALAVQLSDQLSVVSRQN